jgi:hypothetical protein
MYYAHTILDSIQFYKCCEWTHWNSEEVFLIMGFINIFQKEIVALVPAIPREYVLYIVYFL